MNHIGAPVPQCDPGASYRALRHDIDAAISATLASGHYILGGQGAAFEAEFAQFIGAAHAVGCANGTDALVLALRALCIGPGDTVATVSHTATATVAAIELAGATPLLLDIDAATYTMNAEDLAAMLAKPPANLKPVRAIIPVHLYGQAADIGAIIALAHQHGAVVIEDCAQAHGATFNGQTIGTFGAAATFSFYPTKNLGAFGDGGAVATNISETAQAMQSLRQYGWQDRYISDRTGLNSRLDEIQAAILRVKLLHLHAANRRRGDIATAYDNALSQTGISPPARRANCLHVFHQYVVRVPKRDATRRKLAEHGVATGIHYPVPLHLQPAYRERLPLGPAACAETELAAAQILSLPMYPELSDTQVEHVCAALRQL
jgi:dTDP-4-amino-4,6-dideoxygalactose transaminase